MPSTSLTDRDQQMLTMAGAHYQRQGARESDVRKLFTITPTAFYQRINQLLDLEDALAWNPLLVKRLRAQRGSGGGRPRARALGVMGEC